MEENYRSKILIATIIHNNVIFIISIHVHVATCNRSPLPKLRQVAVKHHAELMSDLQGAIDAHYLQLQ